MTFSPIRWFTHTALTVIGGVAPLGAQTTDEILARPAEFYSAENSPVHAAIHELATEGRLVEEAAKWRRGQENDIDSVRLNLLLALAGRTDVGGSRTIEEAFEKPLWMRIQRADGIVEISVSSDGESWKPIARHELLLGDTAWIGVFAANSKRRIESMKLDHVRWEGTFKPGKKGAIWRVIPLADGVAEGEVTQTAEAIEVRNFGSDRPRGGRWFAGRELERDGGVVVRLVDYRQPDLLGEAGVMILGEPGSRAAYLQLGILQGGRLREAWSPLSREVLDLWRRLVDAEPENPDFRIGYAQELGFSKRYGEAADQMKIVLDRDPRKALEWRWLVSYFYASRRLDDLGPYVEKLTVEDVGGEGNLLVRFLRTIASGYNRDGRADRAKRVNDRILELGQPWDAVSMRILVEGAIKGGKRDEILAAFESALLLPSSDREMSEDERAAARQRLNDEALNIYFNDAFTYQGGFQEYFPRGRRLVDWAAEVGVLDPIAARLKEEPRTFGDEGTLDFLRLAFMAAARSEGLEDEIEALVSELPERAAGNPTGMFLCARELYFAPGGRPVAMDWLLGFAANPKKRISDRTAAAMMAFYFADWADDGERARSALESAAEILAEQFERGQELDWFAFASVMNLLEGMARFGLADTAVRIQGMRNAISGSDGTPSTRLLTSEAKLADAESPVVIAAWMEGDGANLRLAIDPKSAEFPGLRHALGTADRESVRRRVVVQSSADGAEWETRGEPVEIVRVDAWSGALPNGARFVRAFVEGSDPEEAPVTEISASANLLPEWKAEARSPRETGIEGWELPAGSTAILKPFDLDPDEKMAVWVSGNLMDSQRLHGPEVKIDPAKRYLLTVWTRTSDVGSKVAWLGVQFLDGDGREIGTEVSRVVRIPVWQLAQREFGPGMEIAIPPDAKFVRLVIDAVYRVDFAEPSITVQPPR